LQSSYFGSFSIPILLQKRSNKTTKYQTTMKNPIRLLILGTALVGVVLGSSSATTLTYNSTPSLTNTNTTFSFTKFDSDLGTLTAVDLLLTSATLGGSVSLQADGGDNTLNSFNASIRTSGTGLSGTQNSPTTVVTSFNPGPGTTVIDGNTTAFSIISSPQIISSTQTYSIGSASFSSYQNVGGTGFTPNFSSLVRTPAPQGIVGDPGTGIFSSASLTALAGYTLRYTYTSVGPSPVPEPGQVAASLLLLGGIGGYVFVKRRRKSAVAAA
jgi:hypothetical protein